MDNRLEYKISSHKSKTWDTLFIEYLYEKGFLKYDKNPVNKILINQDFLYIKSTIVNIPARKWWCTQIEWFEECWMRGLFTKLSVGYKENTRVSALSENCY